MDFNTTVDLILKDLDEARFIIDDFRNYPGVPVIQVELAKSKCKSAAEVIALLKTMKHEEIRPSAEKQQVPPLNINETPVTASVRQADPVRISDTYGFTDRLNEQMGSTMDEDHVSDIIKTKPLTSLADAIGVNDKFLFIREVFNGSPESYNQAILRLESAASYSDAKEVLRSYTGDIKETGVMKQLLALVKRKFPADE